MTLSLEGSSSFISLGMSPSL